MTAMNEAPFGLHGPSRALAVARDGHPSVLHGDARWCRDGDVRSSIGQEAVVMTGPRKTPRDSGVLAGWPPGRVRGRRGSRRSRCAPEAHAIEALRRRSPRHRHRVGVPDNTMSLDRIARCRAVSRARKSRAAQRARASGASTSVRRKLLPGGAGLLYHDSTGVDAAQGDGRRGESMVPGGQRKILNRRGRRRGVSAHRPPAPHAARQTHLSPIQSCRLELTGGETVVASDVVQSVNSTVPNALDTGAGQYSFSASD